MANGFIEADLAGSVAKFTQNEPGRALLTLSYSQRIKLLGGGHALASEQLALPNHVHDFNARQGFGSRPE